MTVVNFNLPINSTLYTEVLPQLQLNIADSLKLSTETSGANYPTNAIKFRNSRFEKWNGSTWEAMATTYAISITGNATTVTNGVYTTGDQTIAGSKTFSGSILFDTATGATVPSIAHKTTTTTGIYFVSATEVGISISGSKVVGVDSTGIYCSGNITAYSDERLKKSLTPIKDSLNKIKELTGYLYTKKQDESRQVGLIAQEVQKVLPEAVHKDEQGYLSLAYGNLAALFVEAIKELDDRIQSLEARV